jgi:Tfp pilus assembly protein PilF
MAQHLCPSCASPWVQEGLFRLEEGDRKSARDSLIQALKIDPGRKDADFFIKRLEKKAGNRT